MATATLPKIGSNYPLPATPRGEFAHGVSLRTGLNPWVVYAWTLAENNDSSVRRRPYNYLNFKSYNGRGAVHVGQSTNCDPATDGGCFPGFADVQTAIANTAWIIQHDFPSIRQSANKGAGPQLAAIGNSRWGTSKSALTQIYNRVLVALYQGHVDPGAMGGAGTQGPPVRLPGGTPLPANPEFQQPGLGGFFDNISNFLAQLGQLFTLGFWLRVGQIVAGAGCLFAGAFILARGQAPTLAVAP